LKIPKELLESISLRRTDNIMAKRKSTKGQTTIYKTNHLAKKYICVFRVSSLKKIG
jgi:hypothetical protein